MNPLTTLVRSLGNDRAIANARSALDALLHEERLVQRLSACNESTAAAPAETTTAAA